MKNVWKLLRRRLSMIAALFFLLTFVSTSVALADTNADGTPTAPTPTITPIAPAEGSSVIMNGRTIALSWQAYPGAHCYTYTIQFNAYGAWSDISHDQGSTCKATKVVVALDPYFARQYGPSGVLLRWRVVTSDPKTPNIASPWTQFTYKATGGVSFKNPKVNMSAHYTASKKRGVKKKPVKKIPPKKKK